LDFKNVFLMGGALETCSASSASKGDRREGRESPPKVKISRINSGLRTFAGVPVQESLAAEHGTELLRDALEQLLDRRVVADERRTHLHTSAHNNQTTSVYSRHIFPPNGSQTACSKSFFSAGAMNYNYITETFFQWTINTGNYSLSNQKGANVQIYA